jgi:hypothetical protein
MTCSLIASVIVFGRLAQITPSEGSRTPWGLVALFLVGLILFVALTGLSVVLTRRALHESTHAHRRRRPFAVHRAWGLDRVVDPDAASAESVPRPPAS